MKTYKGSQGFSIGLPAGWSYQSTDSAGVRLVGPDGQKLLIAWTSTPKGDPVADWKNQEQYMTRSGYTRIRIEKVDYRSWNTADWEFTYQDGGTKYRTIDRGFVGALQTLAMSIVAITLAALGGAGFLLFAARNVATAHPFEPIRPWLQRSLGWRVVTSLTRALAES